MSQEESQNEPNERLWTAKETAYFLQIPIATLYQFNYKGTGPKAYIVGKYRRYIPREVLAWLQNTSRIGIV